MRTGLSRGVTLAALTLGIALLGFAGISLALSGGEPTGQSAQTPIGERSAPSTLGAPGGVADQFEEAPGGGGGENTGNAPGEGSGSAPAAATGSGGGGSLPFTGLLAIPVLLAGLALLVTGMMLRRREATPVQP